MTDSIPSSPPHDQPGPQSVEAGIQPVSNTRGPTSNSSQHLPIARGDGDSPPSSPTSQSPTGVKKKKKNKKNKKKREGTGEKREVGKCKAFLSSRHVAYYLNEEGRARTIWVIWREPRSSCHGEAPAFLQLPLAPSPTLTTPWTCSLSSLCHSGSLTQFPLTTPFLPIVWQWCNPFSLSAVGRPDNNPPLCERYFRGAPHPNSNLSPPRGGTVSVLSYVSGLTFSI